MSRQNIHATGLVLDKIGVVLRGPSGAGKSMLALELIDEWELRGRSARIVGDDRIELEVEKDTVTMYAPEAIEGLVELRGRGIVKRASAKRSRVHLIVDLVDDVERMVEEDALLTEFHGVSLPRCPVPRAGKTDTRHQLLLIREALRVLGSSVKARQKTT
ncbi:MAG: HPr kinase/phosphatase C-terminal domain-containing protein [Devosia sp.]